MLRSFIARSWPFLTVCAVVLSFIGIFLAMLLSENGGVFAYTIDDAYIHLAVAKNLAQHGVWGVMPDHFTSAVSSLAWPALLALVFVFTGPFAAASFVLNVVILVLLLILLDRLLHPILSGFFRVLVILGIVLLADLLGLVFNGMEHLLQIMSAVLFVHLSVNRLTAPDRPPRRWIPMLFATILFTTARYEGLLLVLAVAVLFLLRRRVVEGLIVLTAGVLPLFLFGAFSVSAGWLWLPNSVVVKTYAFWPSLWHNLGYGALVFAGHLTFYRVAFLVVALIVLLLILRTYRAPFWSVAVLWPLLALVALFAHAALARFDRDFFRYEAYVLVLALIAVAVSLQTIVPALQQAFRQTPFRALRSGWFPAILAALLLVSVVPWAWQGIRAVVRLPRASHNIATQHVQWTAFLNRYFPNATVAVNDIGTVSFFTNARILDLVGLADMDVLRMRRAGFSSTANIEQLAEQRSVDLAIVYDAWFLNNAVTDDGIPPSWRKVGEWTIPRNVSAGDPQLSFYAIAEGTDEPLLAALQEYTAELPSDVTVRLATP